jgi:hypothetical protein
MTILTFPSLSIERAAAYVLDAFSCKGGSSRGYQLANCHVTGVDIEDQPGYIGDVFHRGDAVEYIREHGPSFDFVHAGPPCQHDCTLTAGTNAGREYPDLLFPTLAALESTGRPWVLEQPPGRATARMPRKPDLTLCGEMFGLRVIRHRNFWFGGVDAPRIAHVPHQGRTRGWRHGVCYPGHYLAVYGEGGGKGSVAEWQAAMGIDWTDDRKSIAEAIPPAYTEFIGRHLVSALSLELEGRAA